LFLLLDEDEPLLELLLVELLLVELLLEDELLPELLCVEVEFLEGVLVLLEVLEELLFTLALRAEEPLLVAEPARFDELLLVDEFPLVDGFCLVLLEVLEILEELLLVDEETLLVGFATTELDLLVEDEFGFTLLVLLLEVTEEYLEFTLSALYKLLYADLLPLLELL
jgi:hypothetical protein